MSPPVCRGADLCVNPRAGYKRRRYWWESVAILRKFLIVAVTTQLSADNGHQVYAGLWILLVSLLLHNFFAPYHDKLQVRGCGPARGRGVANVPVRCLTTPVGVQDSMERVALGVSLFSLLLGQLIVLGGISDLVRWIITILVLTMTTLVIAWLLLVLCRDMWRAAQRQKLTGRMLGMRKNIMNTSFSCVVASAETPLLLVRSRRVVLKLPCVCTCSQAVRRFKSVRNPLHRRSSKGRNGAGGGKGGRRRAASDLEAAAAAQPPRIGVADADAGFCGCCLRLPCCRREKGKPTPKCRLCWNQVVSALDRVAEYDADSVCFPRASPNFRDTCLYQVCNKHSQHFHRRRRSCVRADSWRQASVGHGCGREIRRCRRRQVT